MNGQFSRTELLIGKNNLEKLKNSRVAVFGAGGVGGYVIEGLVRSGVGTVDVIDNDTVDVSNINRQIIATQRTIGMKKTEAVRERALEINPDININAFDLFYMPGVAFDFSVYDYVVDAVDTITAKLDIIVKCKENNIAVISSMGTGNKLNPAAFEVADIYKTSVCPLARVMRRELKARGVKSLKVVYSREEPAFKGERNEKNRAVPASIAFVPPAAGLIIAGEVVKDIIDR